MTRRRVNRAPVERSVTSSDAVQQFMQRFVAAFEADFDPPRLEDDAQRHQPMLARLGLQCEPSQIEKDMQRRFHRAVWGVITQVLLTNTDLRATLDDLDADDRDRLLQLIGEFAAEIKPLPLTWCEHHGYTQPLGRHRCEVCPCELPIRYSRVRMNDNHRGLPDLIGRSPHFYCSKACRQRAYRRRRRDDAASP